MIRLGPASRCLAAGPSYQPVAGILVVIWRTEDASCVPGRLLLGGSLGTSCPRPGVCTESAAARPARRCARCVADRLGPATRAGGLSDRGSVFRGQRSRGNDSFAEVPTLHGSGVRPRKDRRHHAADPHLAVSQTEKGGPDNLGDSGLWVLLLLGPRSGQGGGTQEDGSRHGEPPQLMGRGAKHIRPSATG